MEMTVMVATHNYVLYTTFFISQWRFKTSGDFKRLRGSTAL